MLGGVASCGNKIYEHINSGYCSREMTLRTFGAIAQFVCAFRFF